MQTLQSYIAESLSPKDIDAIYELIEPFLGNNRISYDYSKFCKEHWQKLEQLILKSGGKKRQKLSPAQNKVIVAASNMDVIYIVWLNHENKYTNIAISCSPASDKVSTKVSKENLDKIEFIWEKGTSIVLPESFKDRVLSKFGKFEQEYYA